MFGIGTINFNCGTGTLIQVDANEAAGGSNFVTIAKISEITGLDEITLYTDGNIIL